MRIPGVRPPGKQSMPRPNNAPLPRGVLLNRLTSGRLQPSPPLVDMLVAARSNYAWPSGMAPGQSQQVIIDLEADVAVLLACLTPTSAHAIVERVSCWAENNKRSHRAILNALPNDKTRMIAALRQFSDTATLGPGLDTLSGLSGVGLVIASKVYRFCDPRSVQLSTGMLRTSSIHWTLSGQVRRRSRPRVSSASGLLAAMQLPVWRHIATQVTHITGTNLSIRICHYCL
jgi:hypothetical protein